MLSLPLLVLFWSLAASWFVLTLYFAYTRHWFWSALSYFLTGLFLVAVPLKVALHATSLFAMFFLSAIWPLWMGQHWFGYNVLSWFPDKFTMLFFTF